MFSVSFVFSILSMSLLLESVWIVFLKRRSSILAAKADDALHKKTEITNFLNYFSQSLKSVDEIENSMSVTARYVADLIEAQALCIFELDGDYLKASGVSGAFPPLHRTHHYILTKPRFLLESLKRDKIKIGDGIIGETAATKMFQLIEDASKDPRISEIETVIPVRTLMIAPITHNGAVTGVVCAVNNRRGDNRPFSAAQYNNFKFIVAQVALAQSIVRVYANLSEQQRINQELQLARSLQASLLPKSFPAWDQFVVHSFTRSSKEVSGDFYDFVQIDENRLLVVVGDASGKGIPACMIMAMARSFIRSNSDRFTNLKDLLRELNFNLFRDTEEDRFITLACCLLDRKEGTVEYARAGHTELQVCVRNHVRKIYPEGSALGLLPNELSNFETICFEFTPEMSLLLFTDGITEAINSKGEEFGSERLSNVYLRLCGPGRHQPESILSKVLEAVDEFTEHSEIIADDQTMVLIQHL
jgi:serine phosphatase RsbU (regulator of sigma subunit)/putative methionine-R-sulfoxide reductase with GAF domain